ADDYARWSRAERLAFWINAYNAFTVKLVLDHYPITSIRKIGWLPGGRLPGALHPDAGAQARQRVARRHRERHAPGRLPRAPDPLRARLRLPELPRAPRRGVPRGRPRSAARRPGTRFPGRPDEEPLRPRDQHAASLLD